MAGSAIPRSSLMTWDYTCHSRRNQCRLLVTSASPPQSRKSDVMLRFMFARFKTGSGIHADFAWEHSAFAVQYLLCMIIKIITEPGESASPSLVHYFSDIIKKRIK